MNHDFRAGSNSKFTSEVDFSDLIESTTGSANLDDVS